MNHANAKRATIAVPSVAPAAVPRPLSAVGPSHQEIAKASYTYWESQGGDADQNWLRCERQLADRRSILGSV